MDSNEYIEIKHLRDLLEKEMVKTKKLNEKIEALVDKKDYPKDVRFYRKPRLFELRKEDDVEDQWEDFCDDVGADEESESFEICVIGIKS